MKAEPCRKNAVRQKRCGYGRKFDGRARHVLRFQPAHEREFKLESVTLARLAALGI